MRMERVLLFNFKDESQLKAVQAVLSLLQIPDRLVPVEGYGMPLGALAAGESLPSVLSSQKWELGGQMMVFAGLREDKLEGLLSMLRSNPACGKIPYKAVLTQVNRNWDAFTLFHELQREHAAMHSAT